MKTPGVLLRVSITTNPEAEDAVANLMERELGEPPSIWSNETDWISVVTVYSTDSKATPTRLRPRLRDGLKAVGAFLDTSPGLIQIRRMPARDWAESWKHHFRPIDIAGRLLVKPTWSRRKPRPGQAVVILDPGLSFGTGQHATTRFCLDQIVGLRNPKQTQSLLDLGTGSGILAIAAAKLGYSPVQAMDFDPDCVRIARENAGLNALSGAIRFEQADVTRLPRRVRARFHVVCANLMHDLLLAERERILARVENGGTLVLAGILTTQFKSVRDAYEKSGLRLAATRIGGSFFRYGCGVSATSSKR